MVLDRDFLGNGVGFPIVLETADDTATDRMRMVSGPSLIEESILLIISTAKGERIMRPDFGCGITEMVFAPNNTTTCALVSFHIKDALSRWEPRIEVQDVTAVSDPEENSRLNININYIIKSSNSRRNLVYPFYLDSSI